jgi:GTP cyclohydrolase I
MKTNLNEDAVRHLLTLIDKNPEREGLKDTPKRYVKFLKEFCNPDEFNLTTFTNEKNDEMIVMSNIPFFSLCEHHLAPFFGVATIGYIPNDKIIGLSKLPRTLEKFSRSLQNQERITTQVANYIYEQLAPAGVGCIIHARHLCVEMRGVRKHDCWTTTSCFIGNMKIDMNCRQEFLKFDKKPI